MNQPCRDCKHFEEMHYGTEDRQCNVGGCSCQKYLSGKEIAASTETAAEESAPADDPAATEIEKLPDDPLKPAPPEPTAPAAKVKRKYRRRRKRNKKKAA